MIFVVADGKIAESGKHEDLLKRGGRYAELHDIQFGEEPPERKRAS
jgi:ABC-type multidrug transport system fused ATPase/permease subunit